jgi:hypothetical protein
MNQSILLRRIVTAVIVTGLLGLVACEGSDPPVIVASQDPPPDPGVIPDDDGIKGEVYDAGHPYHKHMEERWLGRAEIAGTIASFEQQGYTLLPRSGFTVDAYDEGVSTAVTFLEMGSAGSSADRSVLIACYGVNSKPGVSAAEFSTRDPRGEPGWSAIGELGWIRTDGGSNIHRTPAMFDDFSWFMFWDCLMVNAPGTVVGCSYTCAFVGPGYWQCMLMCAVSQTTAKVTACILRTFLAGVRDIQEEPL